MAKLSPQITVATISAPAGAEQLLQRDARTDRSRDDSRRRIGGFLTANAAVELVQIVNDAHRSYRAVPLVGAADILTVRPTAGWRPSYQKGFL